jgi:O-antigen ligase
MESARYARAWDEVIAPVRGGALPFAGRVLLLALIPLTVVWLPLAKLPGLGTVTASDAALMALWGIVAFDLVAAGVSGLPHHTVTIVVLALLIAVLAGIGGEFGPEPGSGAQEFQLLMKKFGLAAVIPLAALRFRSPAMGTWTRLLTLAGIAALVLFTVKPELGELLPRPDRFDAERAGERATGLGTNPNDLAYTAAALAVLHGAFAAGRRSFVVRVLLVLALAGAAACVIASGSRSGLLGAGAAVAFCIVASRIRVSAKLALAGIAVAAVVVGLSMSAVFEERLSRLAAQGARERNLSARLDAQASAAKQSVDHPFGIGFRNIGWGIRHQRSSWRLHTTDSVYFDTLIGAGYPGLFALLLLFFTCWRHLKLTGGSAPSVPILQSGIIAFLVFGMATVVPMSVFLSPIFFLVVSGASHAPPRDA